MLTNYSVKSSAIQSLSYDDETRLLRVTFNHGGAYDYPDVPKTEVVNLVNAPSIGRYFHANIAKYSVRK